jgi:hypothetical protein
MLERLMGRGEDEGLVKVAKDGGQDKADLLASAYRNALAVGSSYGWGVIPVRARIGDSDWETSLFPKAGGYVLPVRDKVRLAESLALGDSVAVEMSLRR